MIDDRKMEILKDCLISYLDKNTTKDKNNKYVCPLPLCKSGSHKNKTSAFALVGKDKWHCFACGKGGDIFDLIREVEGVTDFKEQVKIASEYSNESVSVFNTPSTKKTAAKTSTTIKAAVKPPIKPSVSFKSQAEKWQKSARTIAFWRDRGFNEDIIKRWGLGYDDERKGGTIPYNDDYGYYTIRIEGKSGNGKYIKPSKEETKGTPEPIFNIKGLYTNNKPCFICEGQIDCISIIEGSSQAAAAIAIGGVGHNKLLKAIEEKRPTSKLILAFDNDTAGKNLTEKVGQILQDCNITYSIAEFDNARYGFKEGEKCDANDMLMANAEAFKDEIEVNEILYDAIKYKKLEEYGKNSAKYRLKDFVDGISSDIATEPISTGFKGFDRLLDGGIYEGVYILGAVSSMGKSAFMGQIADNIAKGGRDVLYIALEMSASQIMARSISRHTYQVDKNNAKTTRQITKASSYQRYNDCEKAVINKAIEQYGQYSNHLYIYEGVGDIGIREVKELFQDHYNITGSKPIIIIDYLQILAPFDVRATDKQNTDISVLELRKLSRAYHIPVLAISSFNRENYTSAASMTAFKESGAIEYGSDTLLALQPKGMLQVGSLNSDGKPIAEKELKSHNAQTMSRCKQSIKREIEVVILKQRDGATGGMAAFEYNAMYNHFGEEGFRDLRKGEEIPFKDEPKQLSLK